MLGASIYRCWKGVSQLSVCELTPTNLHPTEANRGLTSRPFLICDWGSVRAFGDLTHGLRGVGGVSLLGVCAPGWGWPLKIQRAQGRGLVLGSSLNPVNSSKSLKPGVALKNLGTALIQFLQSWKEVLGSPGTALLHWPQLHQTLRTASERRSSQKRNQGKG